ncbi:Wzz/FepE/Etk N-terminal domain-containing protein [Roseivivax marinus]|uniref:GumC family protein n=1 Tax=Roseivivax marinus TaxID=1379903 RepID=UPI001F045FE6|nr:Wzz/FepE/Etk N-terminal domain-containing protein [Roseivivax marinus]UMA63297.1 Wzz/FepE/Etk N-terminal domain-containing protein [Roseivivax marinus]
MSLDVRYLFWILRIRFTLFLSVAAVVVAAGLAAAVALPQVYKAQAALLVESSQIPSDLAASTVRTDFMMHLQRIQQRMLTRENMLGIAETLSLYDDAPEMEPDDIVRDMRDRLTFQLSGGRGNALYVAISAEADTGSKAAAIANELVTRTIEADAEFREKIATGTLSFFEKEVWRLGEELDQIDRRILAFQNDNVGALPETLDFRMNRQNLLRERLAQARREIAQLGDQRRRLVDVFEATGRTDTIAQRPPTREEEELSTLRNELTSLSAVFSDNNPKISVLKRRIALLERAIAGQSPADPPDETPGAGVLEAQLVEIDSQIETLKETAATLEDQVAEMQVEIDRTPANGITLGSMERERDNVQTQYDRAVARMSDAATGERIELLSKGERLSVVENAVVPTHPASPNRKLIAAASALAGLVFGLAAVTVAELLSPYIRRPAELTKSLGVTPLAAIPYVATPFEPLWRGLRRVAVLALIVGAAGGGALLLDRLGYPAVEIGQSLLTRLQQLTG